MRFATLTTVALFLAAAAASGQQPASRTKAIPKREERRDSDSTFISRERAAWNALKEADSAAFVRAVGSSPSLFFVWSSGVKRTSAAEFAGLLTKCDTRSQKLDLFNV